MTSERAKDFQTQITKEALALMVIHGKSISVDQYEQAVTLIGQAWALPSETTEENLGLLRQEREVLRRIAAGETAGHVLPEAELPMNASGMETLDNVWDLFETAVRLDSQEQRTAMFTLANELAESQNLLDWIEKTPEEKKLPELTAG